LGYTDRPICALPGEPEAVPAGYQRELTQAAPRRAVQRDQTVWVSMRVSFSAGLEQGNRHRFARDVSSELRVITRALERIDRILNT